jgi:hypothetical protein
MPDAERTMFQKWDKAAVQERGKHISVMAMINQRRR